MHRLPGWVGHGVLIGVVVGLGVTLEVRGFRPAETMSERTLERYEAVQGAQSHLEYIWMVTVRPDGSTENHRILRMISQTENERFTHLRLLGPEADAGHALLTRQRAGRYARLWEDRPGRLVREIPGDRLAEYFADSVWSYSDSLVDWPPASRAEARRPEVFRSDLANVIDFFPFADLEGLESGYSHRRAYFDREAGNLLCVEYYDEEGELLKFLDFLDYRQTRVGDRSVLTPGRLQMTNVQRNETATLVYRQTRYDLQLEDELFDSAQMDEWTKEKEGEMLSLLGVE